MTDTDNTATLLKYFPTLSSSQLEAFARMDSLYADWNSKINVVSRADIGNLFSRHILHSLAIAAFSENLPQARKSWTSAPGVDSQAFHLQ